jgi:hypothetical protein
MLYKKIELCGLDPSISTDAAKAFIDHRCNMGKKHHLTQLAFDTQMKNALGSHRVNMTPDEAIIYVCSETTWMAINIGWILKDMLRKDNPQLDRNITKIETCGSTKTRDIPLAQQLTDRSWANHGDNQCGVIGHDGKS